MLSRQLSSVLLGCAISIVSAGCGLTQRSADRAALRQASTNACRSGSTEACRTACAEGLASGCERLGDLISGKRAFGAARRRDAAPRPPTGDPASFTPHALLPQLVERARRDLQGRPTQHLPHCKSLKPSISSSPSRLPAPSYPPSGVSCLWTDRLYFIRSIRVGCRHRTRPSVVLSMRTGDAGTAQLENSRSISARRSRRSMPSQAARAASMWRRRSAGSVARRARRRWVEPIENGSEIWA